MWKATVHRKVEVLLGQHSSEGPAAWRAITDRTEDLLTSTVMERLTYLPGTMATEILLRAAEPQQLGFVPVPAPILTSEPWPNLRDSGPKLEPDWLLKTQDYTLIVEAKWGRRVVPTPADIIKQRLGAVEARPGRFVHVVLIQSGVFRASPGCPCLVVRWSALRRGVLRCLTAEPAPHIRRILTDTRDALDRRGLDRVFLGSLAGARIAGDFEPWWPSAPPHPVLAGPAPIDVDAKARFVPWK